jgi:hypothetical protein
VAQRKSDEKIDVNQKIPGSLPSLARAAFKKPLMGMEFDTQQKTIVLFEKTAMGLRSHRPLLLQGDAGHLG